jgi:histidine phosphotransfer protein HptB
MIDWEQVESLRADLDDGFDELVEVFLSEVDAATGNLDPAAPPDRMAADLHFLKGAALNLGFRDFARLCSDGERRADAGQTVDLDPVLASFAASRQAFVDGLARRQVA